MIVLGGGPIGCELAQTFQRLGVDVTIFQRGDQLLPREDRDVAEFFERRLINEGVRIIKNADAHSVATSGAGKVASGVCTSTITCRHLNGTYTP